MPRPKSPAKKRHAVQVLFSDEEFEQFERLLSARAEEFRGEGIQITGPMLIRWLIAREVTARALAKPPAEKPAKTASPRPPPAARKTVKR